MKFVLSLSLEHATLVQIAFTLWKQGDIRALIAKFPYEADVTRRKDEWSSIEENVVERINSFELPEYFKRKLLVYIKPIGKRIRQCLEFYYRIGYVSSELLDKISWTPEGIINKKKLAELLFEDESIDVTIRDRLASIYCLSNDVSKFKIPEDCSLSFYKKNYQEKASRYEEMRSDARKQELACFWTKYVKGKVVKIDDKIQIPRLRRCPPCKYALKSAAHCGEKAAVEYFLQFLNDDERYRSLVDIAERVAQYSCGISDDYVDLLCFLLSIMDEEQQLELFKSKPRQVLRGLLKWPWQCFFLEAANNMYDFLQSFDYVWILFKIVKKIINGHETCVYQNIFFEFWQKSPHDARNSVIFHNSLFPLLLSKLFNVKDEANIKLIFKDLTPTHRKRLISNNAGRYFFDIFFHEDVGQWEFLNSFIQKSVSSKNEMKKIKRDIMIGLLQIYSENEFEVERKKWDKFFDLLDQHICEFDKRKISEESDSNSVKKISIIKSVESNDLRKN